MSRLSEIRKQISSNYEPLSEYAQCGAWIEFAKDKVRSLECDGYKAMVASIVFDPWTKNGTMKYRVSEQQAEYMAHNILIAFDRMNYKHETKSVDRIVFKQSGGGRDNWHYHITFMIPESWDEKIFISKYQNCLSKVRMNGVDGKYGSDYKSAFSRISSSNSYIDKAEVDGSGTAAAIYSAHEVRQTNNSFSDSLTVINS